VSTFFYEAKKLFLYQRGVWTILVFFAISAAFLVFGDSPADEAQLYYREQHGCYLETLRGPLTEEKEAFIIKEAQAISDAGIAYTRLLEGYYRGTVSEAEFSAEGARLRETLANSGGFDVIHAQYRYAYENRHNRYLMATNGWAALLYQSNADYLLTVALILLAVPVFCGEYKSEMQMIALCTRRGGYSYGVQKPLLLILVSGGLAAAVCAARLVFVYAKYGLENGDFPMQSLAAFGDAVKPLSLWQAFALASLLKIFGALYFAAIVLLVSVLVKKQALTALLSCVLGFFPALALSDAQQYALPLPAPFINGVGFLRGSVFTQSMVTGEDVCLFREIGFPALALRLAAALLILAVCLFEIRRRNRNNWT